MCFCVPKLEPGTILAPMPVREMKDFSLPGVYKSFTGTLNIALPAPLLSPVIKHIWSHSFVHCAWALEPLRLQRNGRGNALPKEIVLELLNKRLQPEEKQPKECFCGLITHTHAQCVTKKPCRDNTNSAVPVLTRHLVVKRSAANHFLWCVFRLLPACCCHRSWETICFYNLSSVSSITCIARLRDKSGRQRSGPIGRNLIDLPPFTALWRLLSLPRLILDSPHAGCSFAKHVNTRPSVRPFCLPSGRFIPECWSAGPALRSTLLWNFISRFVCLSIFIRSLDKNQSRRCQKASWCCCRTSRFEKNRAQRKRKSLCTARCWRFSV